MNNRILLSLLLSFTAWFAGAQGIWVSGRVTAVTDRQGIPGVTVLVAGTQNGTTTDVGGYYQIEAPADATLVFSFVGMKRLETPIKGRRTLNVEMADEKVNLGEIVVTGYSTDSRKHISGSMGLEREE